MGDRRSRAECLVGLPRHTRPGSARAWARRQAQRVLIWGLKAALRAGMGLKAAWARASGKAEVTHTTAHNKEGKMTRTRSSRAISTMIVTHDPLSGAGMAICSLGCLSAWCQERPGRVVLGRSPGDWTSCSHCSWCGTVIRVPASCQLHPEGCPAEHWLITERARAVVGHLAVLLVGAVDDRLLEHAQHVSETYPELSPADVATVVTSVDDADEDAA
jgi:hypothetical protein